MPGDNVVYNDENDDDVSDNHENDDDDDDYEIILQRVRGLQTLLCTFLRQPEVMHSFGWPWAVVSPCCNLSNYDATQELDYSKRPILVSQNSNL